MALRASGWIATAAAAAAIGGAADGVVVTKVAIITGSQESPLVDTPAFGCARMEVDTEANTLSYRIVFSGLKAAETAAHFHGPAVPGQNAGVLQGLPAGNPKAGVWNYAESVEQDILEGRIYINIHSASHPGGEIRGQVVDMVAHIDDDQDGTATGGQGVGLFNLDACANELSYHIIFSGLSSGETAAHIHGFALHTETAGVIEPLPAGSPKVGTWNYPQADEARILNGETYVNLHSATHPAGEIRGQITRIVVPADGLQENPDVVEDGHGCAFLTLRPGADVLSYYLGYQDLTGPATAAHFHGFVPAGQNAGVVQGIGTANPAIDQWDYPAADEDEILDGLTYVNVHTAAHPGGEIRGQVIFPPPPCPADTNCDGQVNVADLTNVILQWGTGDAAADVDGDGIVAVGDLTAVILAWGVCE